MKRLVYSPYVQAWVKTDDGVIELSPYIVGGSIDRRINQVSSAELVLRNPVQGDSNRLLFTEYVGGSDPEPRPLIHPMDPIVISMTRIQGHPVQVFTGYVDKSPYFQLYPGLCTIQASCTLKRLLYTQWDAALPWVTYFLSQFGWAPNGDTGIVNYGSESEKLKADVTKIQGNFNDGSIGALLYAVLTYIAQWDDTAIWIEPLPPQIAAIVLNLFNAIEGEVQTGEDQFKSLLTEILGTGGQGSGSASTGTGGSAVSSGTITGASKVVPVIVASANRHGVPPELLVAIALVENNLQPTACSGNYAGTFQVQWTGGGGSPPYGHGPWSTHVPTCAEANDVGLASDACAADAAALKGQFGSDLYTWAINVQGVTGNLGGQSAAYQSAGGFAPYVTHAKQLISQYGASSGSSTTKTTSTKNGNNPSGTKITSNIAIAPVIDFTTNRSTAGSTGGGTTTAKGKSPGGKTGKPGKSTSGQPATYSGYVNPIPKGSKGERVDMGVDYAPVVGKDILAIGDANVYLSQASGSGWTSPTNTQAIVAYTLKSGPYSGKSIYVAEDVTPLVGKGPVKAGTPIARFLPSSTGIETGWGDGGGGSKAAQMGQQAPGSDPGAWTSAMGASFNNFLVSLGAPTGIVGAIHGQVAAGYPPVSGATGTTGGSAGSGGSGNTKADAFSTYINLPSIFSQAEAMMFTGKRSFMADQPLFPFVEQLCQASMRNFMSMPNGNFFAFFPDYFGLFGRKYYWEIMDIEIIDGRIDLSDDPLVTHVGVAGDVTQYDGQINVMDMLRTAGIFTILDAFTTGYVTAPGNTPGIVDPAAAKAATTKAAKATKAAANQTGTANKQSAINFLQTYGARPYVQELPMVRSAFFELFLAFQNFMVLWSQQFNTTFELTFMPEIFPGGLIGLPDHHIQLYVEEVSHNFDYTEGFTTMVKFSSPSRLDDKSRSNVSEGVARPAVLNQSQTTNLATGDNPRAKTIIPPSKTNSHHKAKK